MLEDSEALPDEVELVRFREGEGVRDCCDVLDQAGVTYRLSTDAPAFDYAAIGGGAKGSVIVMVPASDEVKARTVLLDDARKVIQEHGLPDDYHLREFDDSELALVVHKPAEWAAFDVAAAEVLLRERGLPFTPPSYELTESDIAEREEKAREFKSAHLLLIVLLVAFVVRMAWIVFKEPHAIVPPGLPPPSAPAKR